MNTSTLDADRARIKADLSGVIEGEVHCDPTLLQMYACDASIYQITPLGVVRPAHTQDVVACVKYAAENQIPIIPRGAASNVAGSCLGQGLILDFSFSMRKIESVGRDEVSVQPGVVLGDLNQRLKSHGRMIGPDPATRMVTTIGGFLAMNGSGSHWVRYGAARESVLALKVVLADGEVVDLVSSTENSAELATQPISLESSALSESLSRRVQRLLRQNADLVRRHQPQTRINQAGYNLFNLTSNSPGNSSGNSPASSNSEFAEEGGLPDLKKLIVGSEGSLGIITEATLQTVAIPEHRGVGLLFFQSLDTAARGALEILKMNVTACDLVDRRLLSLARQTSVRYQNLIPGDAEAMLLVEFEAPDNRTLQKKLEQLSHGLVRRKRLAFEAKTTTQIEQRNFYWRIVRRVIPTMFKLKGDRRALPLVEDIAIAPEKIPAFLQEAHRILNENETTASVFAHIPQGLISIRPLLSLSRPADLMAMQRLANQLYEKVLDYKGTVSGAHGDGMSRSWFLRQQYGPLYNVMADVKRIFDPQNVLNPGKIVGLPYNGLIDNIRRVNLADDFLPAMDGETIRMNRKIGNTASHRTTLDDSIADPLTQSRPREDSHASADALRADSSVRPAKVEAVNREKPGSVSLPVIEMKLNWTAGEANLAARNCNGCSRCRTLASDSRMCPMFRLLPSEEASPRSKANLMRAVMTGQLPPEILVQDGFKEIVDLCFHCHQCRLDCPASVDIPKLMTEAKAQFFATNGLKISDWVLSRLDWLYRVAGNSPMVFNFFLRNRTARWLIDRVFGISQARKLPLLQRQTFLRWAVKEELHESRDRNPQKVAFFVDAYVNWNDAELGRAFVSILKKNNIEVRVPVAQNVSGMSLINSGDLPRARRLAAKNVETLAELVRQGYHVVTTEPSAALALTHEYKNILNESDVELVAENTTDAMNYLLRLHRNGQLELDFKPLNASIGYHLPCHQRVLADEIPALELLRLIPGLSVEFLEKGCSGMAGTYGLKRKNYQRSLRIGFPLINAVRSPTIVAGVTECCTCKIQMEQGTSKPTVHPIKILAMAYGLMPELKDLFLRRSEDRVLS